MESGIKSYNNVNDELKYLEWIHCQLDKETKKDLQKKYVGTIPDCYDEITEGSSTIPETEPPSQPDFLNDSNYKLVIKQTDPTRK